jgi:aminoglycoside phosphotransferase family enzyme
MRPASTKALTSIKGASVGLNEKLRFLSAAENFPEQATVLEVMQTHHAWLFFTDRHVYKMKKPVRYGRIDYSSLKLRQDACNDECRLNRRLAGNTYLKVVPLTIDAGGQLELDAGGCVVEWLIKMRRLPQTRMLDIAAAAGLVSEEDIEYLLRKLFGFYRHAPVYHFAEGAYAEHLRRRLVEVQQELLRPTFELSSNLVHDVTKRLGAYIDSHVPILEQRTKDGRIRDVHGDLRPEHVCLQPREDPQIIDCLEFDPELRRLDYMEELAYFGMECRHMGEAWIEEQCVEYYQRLNPGAADTAPLWNFYAAFRATTRAMHCVWHLLDSKAVRKWTGRARGFLEEAQSYMGLAHIG